MNNLKKMIFLLLATFCNVNQINAANHGPSGLFGHTSEVQHGSIKYVGLVFRHGDRTPTRTYPTDPYKNYSWPVELGELTNPGKQREYEVGKYFQPRYNHLTSDQYTPRNVIMHSSYTNRTLMSAQLFLAGYFPPVGSQIWNENLLWQPIPVRTAPSKYDNVIGMRAPCPRREHAIKHFYSSHPTTREICANYTKMLHYIQDNARVNLSDCKSQKTFRNLMHIQDTLLAESKLNLTLPKWTEPVFPEPLTHLKGLLADFEAEDPTVARLSVGPLLSVIAADMFNIAGLDHKIPKYIFSETAPLHLFAGHDTTIVTLLRALKIYPNMNPSYGAALGFELHLEGGEYHVKVVYEKSVHHPLQILKIPGCSGNCSLKNFKDLIEPLIPKNWDLECQTDEATKTTSTKL